MIFTYLQYVHSSGHEFLDLCKHRNRQMRVELESIRSVKDPSRDPSERSRTREERAGGGGHWFIGSYVPVRLPRTEPSPIGMNTLDELHEPTYATLHITATTARARVHDTEPIPKP
ncbi:hypothetical protein AAVH_38906, partial [Aphelenchoides avenae]